MYQKNVNSVVVIALLLAAPTLPAADAPGRWSEEKANEWYAHKPWLVGCNFSPSTAINQLEMWQADTFDLPTIDRELGWAQSIGFNTVRVFLHHLLWQQDAKSFVERMDKFLAAAEHHGIGVTFVLLDSCWDPYPKLGKQRDPKPYLHNSGWVQCPGADVLKDPARYDELAPYVKGVISRFKDDKRIHLWDIFNEPDNINRPAYEKQEPANKPALALSLIEKAFTWAREAAPSQPISSGVWIGNWADETKLSPMEHFCLEQSDVITFHNYGKLEDVKLCVENLRRYKRPVICTEYMARPMGSTFSEVLPYFKEQKVAGYNWGFVSGKTQTIYPWDSWTKTYTAPPPVWFHDVFHPDGTPYDRKEVEVIRSLTGAKGS